MAKPPSVFYVIPTHRKREDAVGGERERERGGEGGGEYDVTGEEGNGEKLKFSLILGFCIAEDFNSA